MENVIEVKGLVHRFGDRKALDEISFEVGRGEVFGLLGPNGAGKTTTVRLLNGLYTPCAGRMRVAGFDPTTQGGDVRLRSGVLTETPALYERLSATENLRFFGILAGMLESRIASRTAELLAFFDLQERARDRVGTFSKGMKQRLALARALLAGPEILFLDEPTSGLDPEAARQVRDLIGDICKSEGRTVFLCTHNLYEAQRLCGRVAVLSRGRIKAVGSIDDLRAQVAPGFSLEIELLGKPREGLTQKLSVLPGVQRIEADGGVLRASVAARETAAALVAELVSAGAGVLRVEPRQASLEEIYFRLQDGGKEGDL